MPEKKMIKGRGAQYQVANPYHKQNYAIEHIEGVDELDTPAHQTRIFKERPKKIVNKVTSPDVGLEYSINPYQGCEHGCIYCYARNSHEYWGYNAGLDFEQKIIVKENAPALLRNHFDNRKWQPRPIMLSGNTDCYQPIEKQMRITRQLLEIFAEYRHPVGIITKNSLILRDLDLLRDLAKDNLVAVNLSITTLDEKLRQVMEPRTATGKKRLEVIRQLSGADIPVRVMNAPIIPGMNDHEIPEVIRQSAANGATDAGYTIVRLNGSIRFIFEDWIRKAFPDRADKVLNLIKQCHGGKLNDSRFGQRMRGDGQIAEMIRQLFASSKKQYMTDSKRPSLNCNAFRRPPKGQLDFGF